MNAHEGEVVRRLVTSQIANDARDHFRPAVNWLASRDAVAFDLEATMTDDPSARVPLRREGRGVADLLSLQFRPPLFPETDDYRAALAGVRRWTERGYQNLPRPDRVQLANGLGYRLLHLAQQGLVDLAARLIKELARSYRTSDRDPPLAEIGEGLERHGLTELACLAYALAYSRARGQRGWSPIGDSSHEHLLNSAVQINRELALQAFAQEVVAIVSEWPGSTGITRGLVERLAALGETNAARHAWWSAFTVVEKRIPLRAEAPKVFPSLADHTTTIWNVDEGLCALVLTELHDPRLSRKRQALLALRCLIDVESSALEEPSRWFLSSSCPTSSMILALQRYADRTSAVSIGANFREVLRSYSAGGSWCGRMLAQKILGSGKDVGPAPIYDLLSVETAEVSELARRRFEHFADEGIRKALTCVRGATEWVLSRFALHFSDNIEFAERREMRHRFAFGNEGRNRPPTPVLCWETEIALSLADEVLNHLSPQLWRAGRWSPDAEKEVLHDLLPAVDLHLASVASRRPRPPRAWPGSSSRGTTAVPEIPAGREFSAWRIFGYQETFWPPNGTSFDAPRVQRRAFAGAAVTLVGQQVPPGAVPFGTIDGLGQVPASGFIGIGSSRLCVYTRISDWLGELDLILLPQGLADLCGLDLVADEHGVRWVDKSGDTHAIFRTWFVRDSKQFDAAPARAWGGELLVSPTLFSWLERLASGSLILIELTLEQNLGSPE